MKSNGSGFMLTSTTLWLTLHVKLNFSRSSRLAVVLRRYNYNFDEFYEEFLLLNYGGISAKQMNFPRFFFIKGIFELNWGYFLVP